MAYPADKTTFTDPVGTNTLDNPDLATGITSRNAVIEALEDTLGTTLGTNLAKNFAAGDFPVRNTGGGATGTLVQTIVGGTLTSPLINTATVGTSNIIGGTLGSVFIGTPTFSVNAVPGSALSTNAVLLAYTQRTTDVLGTGSTSVTVGLTGTATIPAGGRSVKITGWGRGTTNAISNTSFSIWQGAVATGTMLAEALEAERNTGDQFILTVMAVHTPSAGLGTYNLGIANDAGSVSALKASSTSPAFILVELL